MPTAQFDEDDDAAADEALPEVELDDLPTLDADVDDADDDLAGGDDLDDDDDLSDDDDDDLSGDDDEVDDDEVEDDVEDEDEDEDEEEDEEESLDVLLAREKVLDEDDLGGIGDESREGLTVRPALVGAGEFTCRSCFLVKRRAQLADETRLFCFDCA